MKKGVKIVYCCGVDFQHEIGEAPDLEGKMPLYSSVEELKANKSCWEECGILKLELVKKEWIEPQNLFGKPKEEQDG